MATVRKEAMGNDTFVKLKSNELTDGSFTYDVVIEYGDIVIELNCVDFDCANSLFNKFTDTDSVEGNSIVGIDVYRKNEI